MLELALLYGLVDDSALVSVREIREVIGEGTWSSYAEICHEMINEKKDGITLSSYGPRSVVDFEVSAEAAKELMDRHGAKSKKANEVRKILKSVNANADQRQFRKLSKQLVSLAQQTAETLDALSSFGEE